MHRENESFQQRVEHEADRVLEQVRSLRHALHAEPELGMEEWGTRRKVGAALHGLPLDIREPLLGTDLVADLDVGSSHTICLRADMDALPIEERGDRPHRSRHPGKMHACGHDGHTAILAGAATVLCRLKELLPCNVRFVFQPAEEIVCAGKTLVEKGVCDGTAAAFALHSWLGGKPGGIGCRAGPMFAGAAFLRCEFTGLACHGSAPERGRNPILAAAEAARRIESFHQELRRRHRTAISICTFHAGAAPNAIPETAVFEGSARYYEDALIAEIENGIRAILDEVAAQTGVRVKLDMDRRYDRPLANDARLVELLRETVCRVLSPEWYREEEPSLGAEDFAYYLKDRPGLMFRLLMGENSAPLHSPYFDFNDEALKHGIVVLCHLAATPPDRLPAPAAAQAQ
jgi:amidohydrolase